MRLSLYASLLLSFCISRGVHAQGSITNLLNVSTMRDASLLKLHFVQRGATPRAQLQADWQQLTEACTAVSPSTKRWYWLQDVKALAAYRLPFVQPSEGATAYSVLFDRAAQAPQANAEDVIRIAVREYVFTLGGRISSLGQENTSETQTATIKAWQAYFTCQSYKDADAAKARRVDWISVFKENGVPDALDAVLNGQLKDATMPSYDLLTVGAYVFNSTDPKRAIALQVQAKPLLPHLPDGSPDLHAVNNYYERLSSYYSQADQDEAALRTAQERVALTGQGYVDLFDLLNSTLESPTDVAHQQQKLLIDLCDPSAREEEVLSVSKLLYTRAVNPNAHSQGGSNSIRDQVAAEQLVTLLQSYLDSKRTRSGIAELTARLRLADSLFRVKKLDQAQIIVDGAKSIPATTSVSSEIKIRIDKLRQRISAMLQK